MKIIFFCCTIVLAVSTTAQVYIGQNVNVFQESPVAFQAMLDLEIDSIYFFEDRNGYKADEKIFSVNREQYKIIVSGKDKLLIRESNKKNPLLYAYIKNAKRNLIEMGYHNADVVLNRPKGMDTIVYYKDRLYLTVDTSMGYPKISHYHYKTHKGKNGFVHYLPHKKVTYNKRKEKDVYPRDTVIFYFDYFLEDGEKDTVSIDWSDKVKPFLQSKLGEPHRKKLFLLSIDFDREDNGQEHLNLEQYIVKLIQKNCKVYEYSLFFENWEKVLLPMHFRCYNPFIQKVIVQESDMWFSIFNHYRDNMNFHNYLLVDQEYNVLYSFNDYTGDDEIYERLDEIFKTE